VYADFSREGRAPPAPPSGSVLDTQHKHAPKFSATQKMCLLEFFQSSSLIFVEQVANFVRAYAPRFRRDDHNIDCFLSECNS